MKAKVIIEDGLTKVILKPEDVVRHRLVREIITKYDEAAQADKAAKEEANKKD
mgnify:CR=1 FL=1